MGQAREERAERPRESVWDYPRPPRVEASGRRVRVVFAGRTIAETTHALRVLETSHPPVYYVPFEDVVAGVLIPARKRTWCEFKGEAAYYDVVAAGDAEGGDAEGGSTGDIHIAADAAWQYPHPARGYEALAGHVAFYPGRMDACYVDGERVVPQEGDFYGGWVTAEIEGPFKGGPGTRGW
jgi:uncharacterized protein (DUF427 family)